MTATAGFARGGPVAALPMYDFPELAATHDALWHAVAEHLRQAGVEAVPTRLSRGTGHEETWADPALLLGQGCEYPLSRRFADRVQWVATPGYAARGCVGALYRSAIVVRHDDPASTLADLRGRRCIINDAESNSGMNLLRAAVAPFAIDGRFFAQVLRSGAHLRSAESVLRGDADVSALDCVSFALLQRLRPALTAGLRVLAWTAASPCLPFITARATTPGTLRALRSALSSVLADPGLAAARGQLLLTGIDTTGDGGYAAVLALERAAQDLGYPVLA